MRKKREDVVVRVLDVLFRAITGLLEIRGILDDAGMMQKPF